LIHLLYFDSISSSTSTTMSSTTAPVLDLTQRPRRNRRTQALRAAVRETSLSAQHLVLPLFVQEGTDKKDAIGAMPGCYRLSIDHIVAISKGTCRQIYFN
jgi:delta-aminolevulinic acid dehydratase/porphobilinogen synthase